MKEREPGTMDIDDVEVRELRATDLEWVVRIDQEHSGRSRTEYFRLKLGEARADTGVRISLAALVGGEPAGFLMGRLYYGEFGSPEPVAILDSIGVASAHARKHVANALMYRLSGNLRALGIERIETQVAWDQIDLIGFFQRAGFRPAPRLCLELDLAPGRPERGRA
jgi:ribosomal protein S18 acetylase RimI-like enzyme